MRDGHERHKISGTTERGASCRRARFAERRGEGLAHAILRETREKIARVLIIDRSDFIVRARTRETRRL